MVIRADRRSERIGTAMVAVVLAAVLVSFAVFVVAGGTSARQTSERAADEILERIGNRTAERVEDYTDTARRAAETVLALVPLLGDEALLDTLASVVRASEQVTGAFIGYPDGSFRFVTVDDGELVRKVIDTDPERVVTLSPLDDALGVVDTTVDPADDYDPRTRPWYQGAIDRGGVAWTEPYVFFTSRRPGVTVAVPVVDDGATVAIVGVDLDLSGIAGFVRDLPIDESAEAFLLSSTGDVLAAPAGYELAEVLDDGTVILGDASSVGLGELVPLGSRSGLVDLGDDTVHVDRLSVPEHPDWTVVVRAPEVGFVRVVEDQWRTTLGYTVATMAVVLVGSALLVRRLRRPIDELGRDAALDGLTRLMNRRAVIAAGEEAVERAVAERWAAAVVMIDVDDLKRVNDTLGHAAGDELIVAVADRLATFARGRDLVGRLGGDEFVWVAVGDDRDEVRDRVLEAHRVVSTDARSVTMGVAWVAPDSTVLDRLIAEADGALVTAKRTSKGVVAFARDPEVAGTTATSTS